MIYLAKKYQVTKTKFLYDLLFYIGPIDEFFGYKYGKLDYRCLKIEFKTLNQEDYQLAEVVNYPNNYNFTRITEFKKLSQQRSKKTTIGIEYPGNEGFMAWPLLNDKNRKVFQEYWEEVEKLRIKNIYFIGRFAEYKYNDMDDAVKNALDIFKEVAHGKK